MADPQARFRAEVLSLTDMFDTPPEPPPTTSGLNGEGTSAKPAEASTDRNATADGVANTAEARPQTAGQPLPGKRQDDPAEVVQVRVRVAVWRVIKVSLVEQTFHAEAQLEASWVDRRIGVALEEKKNRRIGAALQQRNLGAALKDKHPPSDASQSTAADAVSVEGLKVDFKKTDQSAGVLRFEGLEQDFFAPRLEFRNCIELARREVWYELFHDQNDQAPVVCLRWKFIGVFQEILELQRFPIDVQPLTIELRCSWEVPGPNAKARYDVRLVKNLKYRSMVNTLTFVQQSEYQLSDRLTFQNESTLPEESSSEKVRIDQPTPPLAT
jgi:hypothetical protein